MSARKSLAVAIAVPLVATGMAFAAAGSAHAAAVGLDICHSTNSAKNPYRALSVPIVDPTLNGHTNDIGPIYTVGAPAWGDIIPPFTYTDKKTGVVTNFPGLNWTPAGQALLAAGCGIPGAPAIVSPVAPTVVDAACVAGALTAPTLTLASSPVGVTYSASVAGPYKAGDTLTVTASIADPALYTFTSPGAGGWVFVTATTETYTVTFANPACVPIGPGVPTVVSPVAPTITDSVCAAGAATAPTLAFAALPGGVVYTASAAPPYKPGQTLTVTASIIAPLLDTFAAPGTGGWTFVGPAIETYDVTFAAAPVCGGVGGVAAGPTTVTPLAPTFGDPGCGANGATAPFVTTPSTPTGVAYSVLPAGPYTGGQTVTVTATITDPAEQFVAPSAGGWTFVDATHETIAHTFAAAPTCSAVGGLKAVSAHPTFADASCVDGAVTGASYTLPDVDGVRYVVDGQRRAAGSYPAANGSTVTIRLVATDGFTLRDSTPVVHEFPSAPPCLGVEPVTTSRQPLAATGARVVPLAELGGLLTVLGIAMLFGGRRRNTKAL